MPHELDYDAGSRRLKVGAGFIANVSPEVWTYEVSGKNVLSQWWSYRRQDRSKPPMGDRRPHSKLSEIQPTIWPAEYTTSFSPFGERFGSSISMACLQADRRFGQCQQEQMPTNPPSSSGALGAPIRLGPLGRWGDW